MKATFPSPLFPRSPRSNAAKALERSLVHIRARRVSVSWREHGSKIKRRPYCLHDLRYEGAVITTQGLAPH